MEKITIANLPAFVRQVLGRLQPKNGTATVIALSGELGAGKTTFVKSLARELGVTETVQSPTYVLMKKYEIPQGQGDTLTLTPSLSKASPFKKLIHIDLYRLEMPQEVAALKLEQYVGDPAVMMLIEWPERASSLLPAPDLTLTFSSKDVGEGERYIEVV